MAKRERVWLKMQILAFFGSVFSDFQESSKTNNMNIEDLKQQKTAHTFSISLSLK